MNIISNNDKKETCILREREKIKTETRQGTLNIHSMVWFKKRKTGFLETPPQKKVFSPLGKKKKQSSFFFCCILLRPSFPIVIRLDEEPRSRKSVLLI